MMRGIKSGARLNLWGGGIALVVLAWAAIAWCACASNAGSGDSSVTQGSGDADGGAATPSAGAVPESEFCNEVAAGLCAQVLPCCDSLDAGSDPATCRSQVSAKCTSQVVAPDVVYDPVAASECVAFYQNRTGNLTVEGCAIVHPATSNACDRAFVGTLTPGLACSTDAGPDNECAPSDAGLAACLAAAGGTRCAVVPYVSQGQPCDNLTTACRPPLLCSPRSHICLLPQPFGAACSEPESCTSFNCVDGGCGDVAPIAIDESFCRDNSIQADGG